MNDILRRIQKLLALAGNNTNAEEAASAAAKAQALMDEHRITQAMLAVNNDTNDDDEEVIDFKEKGAPLDVMGERIVTWKAVLGNVIASANQCYLFSWRGEQATLQIIGRPSDVDAVRYLYGYLVREIEGLTARAGRGCGKTWCNNFRLGCIDTISLRLKQQHAQTERDMYERAKAEEKALVLVDRALEKLKARSADAERMARKNHPGLRTRSAPSRYDADARTQGQEAGKSISLGARKGALGAGTKALRG